MNSVPRKNLTLFNKLLKLKLLIIDINQARKCILDWSTGWSHRLAETLRVRGTSDERWPAVTFRIVSSLYASNALELSLLVLFYMKFRLEPARSVQTLLNYKLFYTVSLSFQFKHLISRTFSKNFCFSHFLFILNR